MRKVLAAVFLVLFAGGVARADYYFLSVFGSQSPGAPPSRTHTWFEVVRCDDQLRPIDWQTISWLPYRDGGRDISITYAAEPGFNYGMHYTTRLTLSLDQSIKMWGPFEVHHELYQRAAYQTARLRTGRIGYQAFDLFSKEPSADQQRRGFDYSINCMRAVKEVNVDFPTLLARGHRGSQLIAETFTPWIVDRPETRGRFYPTYPLVATYRGLDVYPMDRYTLPR